MSLSLTSPLLADDMLLLDALFLQCLFLEWLRLDGSSRNGPPPEIESAGPSRLAGDRLQRREWTRHHGGGDWLLVLRDEDGEVSTKPGEEAVGQTVY